MKVLFAAWGDQQEASTRYRVKYLLPYIKESDIEPKCMFLGDFYDYFPKRISLFLFAFILLLRAPFSDVVFLHRLPLPAWYASILNYVSDDIIYDFDDAQYTSHPWDESSSQRKDGLDATIANSSLVIAGSPTLKEYAEKINPNTYSIPTGIPKGQYTSYWDSESKRDRVSIGWIGHPDNLYYLREREKEIAELLDEHPNVELNIITSVDSLSLLPFQERLGSDVHYKEWSLESELEYLSEMDIGIRPLTDDEWTRAKGGFTSVVQCMGLGIPVVVTPVGLLSEIVVHKECGYHAEEQGEFKEYLSKLIEDENLRIEYGLAARDRVSYLGFWSEDRAEEVIDRIKSLDSNM